MTFSEMQTRVEDRLRAYGNLTWGDTEIKRYINDGYVEFARLTHICRKQSNVTITADTALFAFPTVTGVGSYLKVWRAEWDDKVLVVRDTSWMDAYMSSGWRDTKGTTLSYIMTDGEDRAKIRVYPMIDDSDDIGSKVLTIEYSYIPSSMSLDSDACLLPAEYSTAPVEWACSFLQEDSVQSQQNPGMGDRAEQRFFRMVRAAKRDVHDGMFFDDNEHAGPGAAFL